MTPITVTADHEGRIRLPPSFANRTVVIEEVSDTEIRIRKADAVPEDEVVFAGEIPLVLSPRDRELLFAALENPPPANEALRKLLAKYPSHG
jgi:Protein of unknown function (DUF1778)